MGRAVRAVPWIEATNECPTTIGRELAPSLRRTSVRLAGSGWRWFSTALVQWRM